MIKNIKRIFKKSGWTAVLAILSDILAFLYWSDYLATGMIHDGKHDITFIGEHAAGHLIGISLMALVFSYYFLKSLLLVNHDSKALK